MARVARGAVVIAEAEEGRVVAGVVAGEVGGAEGRGGDHEFEAASRLRSPRELRVSRDLPARHSSAITHMHPRSQVQRRHLAKPPASAGLAAQSEVGVLVIPAVLRGFTGHGSSLVGLFARVG